MLVSRNTETNGRFTAFCFISSNLFRGQVAAFAHVTGHFAFFNQCLAFFFQFFVSAVAVVCFAFCEELVGVFFVKVKAFSLTVRAIRTAYINAFIPIHTKPFQCSFNVFFRFTAGAFQVGIFNSQNQFAAGFASQQPVEQRGASTANVKRASGAGRKSYSYFIRHIISLQKIYWFITKIVIILLYNVYCIYSNNNAYFTKLATASAAMPSPRPVKPNFSVVVAFTLTQSSSILRTCATRVRITGM